MPAVPITSRTRLSDTATVDPVMMSGSMPSPNQTTPGRSKPPHLSQRGGMGRGTRLSSISSPQAVQRILQIEPWNSSTFLLPDCW